MTNRSQQFDLYLCTQELGTMKVAQAGLLEESGVLTRMQFRYTPEYLECAVSFALDPVQLPLQTADIHLTCSSGGIPGLLDDYLPDNWGKTVLARLAFYKHAKRIRIHSPLDMLGEISSNRIGALQWLPKGQLPDYDQGADIKQLGRAEQMAQVIDSQDWSNTSVDDFSLAYLANAGTGVGGARPKALIYDSKQSYLAKFNSLSNDTYNNARVELACLNMANHAGLQIGQGKILTGINEREVLLLERFDIDKGARKHIISVNALLKDKYTQGDRGGAFTYDDVANLIKRYSIDPVTDLTQLLQIMLFNAAINNTDDHERNFSFWYHQGGYRLSPAYDLVPTLATGQYHVAGYQHSPFPPKPSQVKGRIFGLPAPLVKQVAEQITTSVAQWPLFAQQAGVSEHDQAHLNKVIRA